MPCGRWWPPQRPPTPTRTYATWTPDQLQPGTLAELTSPSLFAERKVVVVRNAQDLSADTVKDVKAYLGAPAEEITLVLLHAGGAKGRVCWTPPARRGRARWRARR